MKKKCYDHLGNEYSSQKEMCEAYGISVGVFEHRKRENLSIEEILTMPVNLNYCHKNPSTVCCDHLGNKYDSKKEMCKAYGISYAVYKTRAKWGMTLEEILTTPIGCSIKNVCYDHLGNKYNSQKEMCEAYGMKSDIYARRIKKGYSTEEALTKEYENLGKECYDHLGNRYDSIKKMCKVYGITDSAYRNRLLLNWSVEKILTTPLENREKECYDHLGNRYGSITEMCEMYGISLATYKGRINRLGWNKEKALTTPSRTESKKERENTVCFDYKGNMFNNLLEMCEAYGIKYRIYQTRIKAGYSIEEALTIPLNCKREKLRKHIGKECYDHLGNKYSSVTEMCKAYGVSDGTYRARIFNNWSVEEALTTPPNCKERKIKYYDHLGNGYISKKEMCEAHHIPYSTFVGRVKRGMSVEEALATPVIKQKNVFEHKKEYYDHLGNRYDSVTEMCKAYHTDVSKFHHRVYRGWSIERALTDTSNQSAGEKYIQKYLEDKNITFLFDVSVKTVLKNYIKSTEINLFLEFAKKKQIYKDIKSIYLLRFDFVLIFNNQIIIIEHDGMQHYADNGYFHGMSKRRKSDRTKDELCVFFGIPIVRIQSLNALDMNFIAECLNDVILNASKLSGKIVFNQAQRDISNKTIIELNNFCQTKKIEYSKAIEQALQIYMNDYENLIFGENEKIVNN